jgi:hypothetical protein
MEFRSPIEFARFLSSNGLSRLDSTFSQLINCINNCAASCTCDNREDKARVYGICTKLYIDGARHVVPRLKNEFLSKTTDRQLSFYTEQGQLIVIVSR